MVHQVTLMSFAASLSSSSSNTRCWLLKVKKKEQKRLSCIESHLYVIPEMVPVHAYFSLAMITEDTSIFIDTYTWMYLPNITSIYIPTLFQRNFVFPSFLLSCLLAFIMMRMMMIVILFC